MKNVIYINCFADPWLKVADKMQREYGYKPVYWVGYNEDNSEKKVPENFDGIVYHKYFDAWKGVFPKQIADKASEMYIDVDFVRQFASEELQAIKMMDRLDFDQRSFNFMERQRHFRNLVRSWMAVIEMYKPDLVVAPVMPHRVYDYVLYLLCKYVGIPYIMFDHTPFQGRFIVIDNIITIGDMFLDRLHNLELEDSRELEKRIPKDIFDVVAKVKSDYSVAIPKYMVAHSKKHKTSSNVFGLAKKFLSDNKTYGASLFGKEGLLRKGVGCYYKNSKLSFENSKYSILKYAKCKIKANGYKKKLLAYYESMTLPPESTDKYVIYFMHYQPEATTCPATNIFVDQQLCIDTLLNNLPEDYIVYVKEHPSQFFAHEEGQTSRIKEFYNDISKNNRVKLISTKINSFSLIEGAKAISTGTGTVGWEAIVRRKPVIIFGFSWYENYKGVHRVYDSKSASLIRGFIESYVYDEHSLLAYLVSFSENTRKAYYYKGVGKDTMGMSETDCVDNIIKSLLEKVNG